ncbi:hypothetical protein B0A49_02632 [Cryomyces minteri]|uniref:DUF6697 domain-containing protein n=1 Tax=Cryomyces minteri TaxID=331657 RepID=A0A4U0X889_9PEZI|nr:hypothetical protein B0A49_02632 [Cryomyces minteri]
MPGLSKVNHRASGASNRAQCLSGFNDFGGPLPTGFNPAVPEFQPSPTANDLRKKDLDKSPAQIDSETLATRVKLLMQLKELEEPSIAIATQGYAISEDPFQKMIRLREALLAKVAKVEHEVDELKRDVCEVTDAEKMYMKEAKTARSVVAQLRKPHLGSPGNVIEGGAIISKESVVTEKCAALTNTIESPAKNIPPHLRGRKAKPVSFSSVTTMSTEGETKATLNDVVSSVENLAITAVTKQAPWQPLAIRNLPALSANTLNCIPATATMQTFTFEFLQATLGGTQWSPGFYFVPSTTATKGLLSGRTYWLLNREYEPFLPKAPDDHGAKVTAFFNETVEGAQESPDEDSYLNVPVFICAGADRYAYYGAYSQLRLSDRLDFDRMQEVVPHEVKMYWADQLSDPNRPAWVTRALKAHFWPPPTYGGPLPIGSSSSSALPVVNPVNPTTPAPSTHGTTAQGTTTPPQDAATRKAAADARILRALRQHARALRNWEAETATRAQSLSRESLLLAMQREDAAEEPGLRLWWEYLEAVGWDEEFFGELVTLVREKE